MQTVARSPIARIDTHLIPYSIELDQSFVNFLVCLVYFTLKFSEGTHPTPASPNHTARARVTPLSLISSSSGSTYQLCPARNSHFQKRGVALPHPFHPPPRTSYACEGFNTSGPYVYVRFFGPYGSLLLLALRCLLPSALLLALHLRCVCRSHHQTNGFTG